MNFTPEEAAAIRKLCSGSSVARQALSDVLDMPSDCHLGDGNANADYRQRLHVYAFRLRGYLLHMATELDELPHDADRLRSEAVGILLALRDIERQFPEIAW